LAGVTAELKAKKQRSKTGVKRKNLATYPRGHEKRLLVKKMKNLISVPLE